jgi:ParB-like chromosome segregation protein Spo0J
MTAVTILPGLQSLAVAIDDLRTMPGNPHHGDIAALKRSWSMFGQRRPLVGRKDAKGPGGEIIAGNHGLETARELGWTHVAVLWVDDDDVRAKAFAAADNHTAELGFDDPELLADWLLDVRAADVDLFDATTYEPADLLKLLDPDAAKRETGNGQRGAPVQEIASSWAVMVTCEDETSQVELLERLTDEGFDCRALIS